eukprot:1131151-Alexandrium_andersonii.AAC.1
MALDPYWLVNVSSGPRIQSDGGGGPSLPSGPNGPRRGSESAKVGDHRVALPGAGDAAFYFRRFGAAERA